MLAQYCPSGVGNRVVLADPAPDGPVTLRTQAEYLCGSSPGQACQAQDFTNFFAPGLNPALCGPYAFQSNVCISHIGRPSSVNNMPPRCRSNRLVLDLLTQLLRVIRYFSANHRTFCPASEGITHALQPVFLSGDWLTLEGRTSHLLLVPVLLSLVDT